MNQIIVHGNLVADVTERDYRNKDGKSGKMSTFTVAAGQRWGDTTNYFDCAVFGKQAELIATHFHKGQEIIVRGEMNQRIVKDEDGATRKYWTINVDQFDFCGRKADNTGGDSMGEVTEDVPF